MTLRITLYGRWNNLKTLKRCRNNVVMPLCVNWLEQPHFSWEISVFRNINWHKRIFVKYVFLKNTCFFDLELLDFCHTFLLVFHFSFFVSCIVSNRNGLDLVSWKREFRTSLPLFTIRPWYTHSTLREEFSWDSFYYNIKKKLTNRKSKF